MIYWAELAGAGVYQAMEHALDFDKFLAELGVTKEQMEQARASMPTPLPIPEWAENTIAVAPSKIEGVGVFTRVDLVSGEVVGPAYINGQFTKVGRFTNHWPVPNTKPVMESGVMNFVACRHIAKGEEVLVDYRAVRSALSPP